MGKTGKSSLWLLWIMISLLTTVPLAAQVVNATVKINGMI